ncbi:hypothetical protein [Microbacterium sp. PM5]|uniref:hypothetical protein n=1 Tax=Microbacterium sp. PM5 TaxID=2014534 RepID=UPI000DD0F1B5|nr:hypothetical protein [Microbacterium sp. PM5]AXA97622.1 hypothetical protein CEP17_14995 [Microbacterium sp. PM5]
MAHTATVAETAQDAYLGALISLAGAAEQLIFDADAGRLDARASVEMLRKHVEAWHDARGDYFSIPARELRRSPDVHPAHEEIEP